MASSTLIDHWCEQLRETEELIEHGSPSLRWLRVAYARLYRFLLSAYGAVPIDGAERAAADTAEQAVPTSLAVDDSVDFRGKPARTPDEIRAALRNVHGVQDEVEAGPLISGIHPTDWIRVATTRDGTLVAEHRFLAAAGIKSQETRIGEEVVLEVPLAQREEARELLAALRASREERPLDEDLDAQRRFMRGLRRLVPIWVLLLAFLICGGLAAALCTLEVSPGQWAILRAAVVLALASLALAFGIACLVRGRADHASHTGE